ncbi:hypothetical protein OEZ85_001163 [Tetradesmus obliquus]|uniref:SUMO-activating enzyme subunit n=1 Tax=Tetradesmus obliquus TaxID=3088 RepID=A0ABY8UMK8_TETOB|nr:hypothetical protein OEZ85_001163 [Tetradesmus obliquus]
MSVPGFFKVQEGEGALAYAQRVFERLYCSDIKEVLIMEELWKTRTPPSPLILKELLPDAAAAAAVQAAADSSTGSASKALGLPDQEVWSVADSARVFLVNIVWSVADSARVFLVSVVKFLQQRQAELGEAVFDKDDDLAVDFVAAAANLRAACYGIPQQKRFDAKGMAGNIIHAIATTNAIVGGLIVVEALKLLAGMPEKCTTSFLRIEPSLVGSRRSGRVACLVHGEAPGAPNPSCMVCSKAAMHLTANTETMTLQQLVDKVLKQRLAVNQPYLCTAGGVSYEEGEGLEDDEIADNQARLPKALAALPGGGIVHGTVVYVQDQGQALSFEMHVSHQAEFDPEQHPDGFILSGKAPEAQQQEPAAAAAAAATTTEAAAGKKRSRDESSEQQQQQQDGGQAADEQPAQDQQQAKRQKQDDVAADGAADAAVDAAAGTQDDPVEVIDSDEDDCIVVD